MSKQKLLLRYKAELIHGVDGPNFYYNKQYNATTAEEGRIVIIDEVGSDNYKCEKHIVMKWFKLTPIVNKQEIIDQTNY